MATCPSGHESAAEDFCDVCGILIGAPALSSIDLGPLTGPAQPVSSPYESGTGGTGPAGDGGPATVQAEPCPRCGAPRTGQFCEDCGHNFAAGGEAGATRFDTELVQAAPEPTRYDVPPVTDASAAHGVSEASSHGFPSADGQGENPPAVRENGVVELSGTWTAVVSADREYFETVVSESGPGAGIDFPAYCPERRFTLSGQEVRIGRRSASRGIDPEIDLTGPPADPGISRLHAVLIAGGDGTWSVLDPGSANGTLVNGDEITAGQPVPLREGDRVNLGAWTLLVISRDN